MRHTSMTAGCLILAALWLGPLPALASRAFFAHMMMHMGVVAVAAPLLALGVAGGRYDPVPLAPKWFAAIPASVVELIVVWGWHAPLLHHEARHCVTGFMVEQGTFLLAGLWLWLSALGGHARDSRDRSAAGIVGLLLTAMHMTLLGALLGLAPRPLYAHADGIDGQPFQHVPPNLLTRWDGSTDELAKYEEYSSKSQRKLARIDPVPAYKRPIYGRFYCTNDHDVERAGIDGLSPLEDQHLGGAIMLLVGGISYLAGGLGLTARLLRTPAIASRGQE